MTDSTRAPSGAPRLRIAQIAPCWLTVPPDGYGGIEAMIADLADGLVERGHDVTLFASAGSDTKATPASYYEEPPGMAAAAEDPFMEVPHVLSAYERAEEFDVIHDHTFPLGPSIGAHLGEPPIVHTVHGPPASPNLRAVYDRLSERVHLVAISDYQRQAVPGVRFAATVYNGIRVDQHPWSDDKDDYLLFVGRMSPEKGAHLAVEVARRLGRRLIIAGKMREPAEKEYFRREVEPRLTDDVEVVGEASGDQKLELYARAACTLMPIQWPEPFGLVMVESMACGTPVVALRNGSVPEIVDHGVTGFVADDLDQFVDLVPRVGSIDPKACRQAVVERFSKEAMVEGYEQVYCSIAA